MGISPLSRQTLSEHYAGLGDIRRDFRNYNLMRLVASKVRGQSVLDIGCGNGFMLDLLRKQGKTVSGIEPLAEMIALANNYLPGLTMYKGMAEEVDKLVSHKVDTVIMTDVLEHIEDDQAQLRKIYSSLNPGGQLILVVPAYPLLYGRRDQNMGHFRRYAKNDLVKLCSETGFSAPSIRYWNLLGVLPYFFYEKILRRGLNTSLRASEGNSGILKKTLNSLLHAWFSRVENNLNMGVGLSIICVAGKAI